MRIFHSPDQSEFAENLSERMLKRAIRHQKSFIFTGQTRSADAAGREGMEDAYCESIRRKLEDSEIAPGLRQRGLWHLEVPAEIDKRQDFDLALGEALGAAVHLIEFRDRRALREVMHRSGNGFFA